MPQSVSVTGILINFLRVVIVRQLIFVDSRVSKDLSSVGVVEMRVLHEIKAFLTESGVGSCTRADKLALLLGRSGELSVHLRVVGLQRVDVGHEGILHVRVRSSVGIVFVVEECTGSSVFG